MYDAEQLDTLADKVGNALGEANVLLQDLHHAINFGPDLETKEVEDAFRTLGDVLKLVEVANNLYPYPWEDDGETYRVVFPSS